ncbi:hypothetical protein P691DRAFT_674095, partial [Macrolepiota fuliginosa MF-IS2]
GLPVGERKSSNVFTHAEFTETYADLNQTTLHNGENLMFDFYKNVKFLFWPYVCESTSWGCW